VVNVLSEYPDVPPKRDYVRRNIIGKDKNDYHLQYYHEVLAQPKPEEKTSKPRDIPSSIILHRMNGAPMLEVKRFCPMCGWQMSVTRSGRWQCPNDLCSDQSILFGRKKKFIRKITFVSALPSGGKDDV